MYKKITNIFSLLFFLVFVVLTVNYYFSEKNIISTNKTRSLYPELLNNNLKNLPLLKNDTSGTIEYRDDIEIFKKKKKKHIFWDLISG